MGTPKDRGLLRELRDLQWAQAPSVCMGDHSSAPLSSHGCSVPVPGGLCPPNPNLVPSGRGLKSHAYIHSVQLSHHVFLNLHTLKFYCLPDNYEIIDSSLEDITVRAIFGGTLVLGARVGILEDWLCISPSSEGFRLGSPCF